MNTPRPHSLFSTTGLARAARRTTALLLAGAALATTPLDSRAASATPPDLMAYQGFLVDANGNPLAPTTPLNYPAIFRIHTASQGGARLWSEQQIVTVDKGNFSVLLGQGTQYASELRPALSTVMGGADASDLYVGVTVTIDGSSQEILPRLRLMTSPYAFLATRAANLVQPNGTPVISYSGGQIQLSGGVNVSGTVTGNGSGLSSLSASSITTGTLSDARLTGNIARNNTGNTFAGNQRFNGLIGINRDPATWLDVTGNFRVGNTSGDYLWAGYGPGGGKTLLAVYTGFNNNGPQIRFTGSAGGGFTDIGQNGTGDFVIEQNDVERLVVQPNGNVGIGTTTPATTLDIASSTTWRPLGVRGNGGTDMVVMGNLVNRATIGAHNSAGNAWAPLAINPGGGNVGIGTTAPAAKLDVRGFASTALGVNGYFWRTGVIPNVAAGNFNLSIYADQDIAGQVFRAWSDERIKRIEGRSDTSSDLATLLDIEVTDYTYIDTVAKGLGRQKKVVAQQVEKVFPQAINQLTDTVPDIYEQAIVTNGWVQLATDLKPGDRVRLIGEKEEGIHEVLEVRESAFRTSFQPTTEKVFVFGREVKDFRSVDYDALAMLNVSATQELAKQVRELKVSQERLATLEAKANKLEMVEAELLEVRAKLASQQAVNARWESRFEALEKHLAMQPATTNASVSDGTKVAAR